MAVFVRRRSYGCDLVFEVLSVGRDSVAKLRCCTHRIIADAPLPDLVREPQKPPAFLEHWYAEYRKKASSLPGRPRYPIRILHVDGDPEYLSMCLTCYQRMNLHGMNLNVSSAVVEERRQPYEIATLLRRSRPDILIITGHDALPRGQDPSVLSNYRSSLYFAEAVRRAREYEPHPDRLIIFAGACQSHYEELIGAGANFASSPGRILIHAMDPVIVCETVALTPFDRVLRIDDLIQNTYSGPKGIGGFDTYGLARYGK